MFFTRLARLLCATVLASPFLSSENASDQILNEFRTNLVRVPGGVLLMGTSQSDLPKVLAEHLRYGYDGPTENNRVRCQTPQHSVRLAAFSMGRFEVTREQWKAVSLLPSKRIHLRNNAAVEQDSTGDRLPVASVSWQEAIEFCKRLSAKWGVHVDLPSEAQWEYACRAKSTTDFSFGDTLPGFIANYNVDHPWGKASPCCTRGMPVPVGSLGVPNGWGLFDMHGNVSEWCLDQWHENYKGAPGDGSAWMDSTSERRVIRGGSFINDAMDARSAFRDSMDENRRAISVGFRVIVTDI